MTVTRIISTVSAPAQLGNRLITAGNQPAPQIDATSGVYIAYQTGSQIGVEFFDPYTTRFDTSAPAPLSAQGANASLFGAPRIVGLQDGSFSVVFAQSSTTFINGLPLTVYNIYAQTYSWAAVPIGGPELVAGNFQGDYYGLTVEANAAGGFTWLASVGYLGSLVLGSFTPGQAAVAPTGVFNNAIPQALAVAPDGLSVYGAYSPTNLSSSLIIDKPGALVAVRTLANERIEDVLILPNGNIAVATIDTTLTAVATLRIYTQGGELLVTRATTTANATGVELELSGNFLVMFRSGTAGSGQNPVLPIEKTGIYPVVFDLAGNQLATVADPLFTVSGAYRIADVSSGINGVMWTVIENIDPIADDASGSHVELTRHQVRVSQQGDAANDTIFAENQAINVIDGGGGNDTIYGQTTALPYITPDSLSGGDGLDRIFAGSNAAVMQGDAGNDSLVGGEGSDTIVGGVGNDTIIGGAGIDWASYATDAQDLAVNLFGGYAVQNSGQPGAMVDTLALIENIFGSNGNDFLVGDNVANRFEGGFGNDNLWGYGGNDTLIGGDGNDVIVGGDNNDSLESGLGQDWLYGQAGADTLRATDATANAFNVLVGGDGNDTLFGGPTGFDYLYGGDGVTGGGNDTFVISASSGIKVMNDFEAGGVNDVVRLLGTPLTNFAQVQAKLSFSATINGTVLVIDPATQLWFLGLQPNQFTASDFAYA